MLAVAVGHELGRRQLPLVGPDGPVGVIDVQLRRDGGKVQVGRPECINRAYVAPVGGDVAHGLGHAGHAERMGQRLAFGHRTRNHVLAEVVAGVGVGQVLFEQAVEVFGVEHVDAHAGQRHVVVPGHGGRVGGLFHEGLDVACIVHGHHPEGMGFAARHLDAAHGAAQAVFGMVLDHDGVVHLVDMVAGQHHHIVGPVGTHDVEVLVDGVGGAAVPVFLVHPLLGGQQVHHLVQLGSQKAPAALQVAQERVGFVLRQHRHAADARVQAVGEREVNDAELAAKVHRRLGPAVGELLEP